MNKKELKEILTQHQLWLDSDGEQGRRANFRVAHLSRADLIGADLTGADLRGANLTGAQLGPEIRGCVSFEWAKVSEDQLAWLCLHPRFGEWVSGLKITST